MPKPQDEIQSLLNGASVDPTVVEAVMDIDATLQNWRRKVSTRELGKRALTQEDARRSILELPPTGHAVVPAVQSYEWLIMGDFLSKWTEAEIDAFMPLLARFAEWYRDSEETEGRYAPEIDALARNVADARKAEPIG